MSIYLALVTAAPRFKLNPVGWFFWSQLRIGGLLAGDWSILASAGITWKIQLCSTCLSLHQAKQGMLADCRGSAQQVKPKPISASHVLTSHLPRLHGWAQCGMVGWFTCPWREGTTSYRRRDVATGKGEGLGTWLKSTTHGLYPTNTVCVA